MIIGNLGQDPEVRHTQGGAVVSKFSVACTEKWKDKQTGEQREQTEWITVEIWRELPDFFRKGARVFVEGKIRTREHEGKYYTKIQASNVQIMSSPRDGESRGAGAGSQARGQSTRNNSGGGSRSQANDDWQQGFTATDDDIPF